MPSSSCVSVRREMKQCGPSGSPSPRPVLVLPTTYSRYIGTSTLHVLCMPKATRYVGETFRHTRMLPVDHHRESRGRKSKGAFTRIGLWRFDLSSFLRQEESANYYRFWGSLSLSISYLSQTNSRRYCTPNLLAQGRSAHAAEANLSRKALIVDIAQAFILARGR